MADDASLDVGDVVTVPGGMTGTVRFVGSIHGKQGHFAGVELAREFAARGKNDGDVDGVQYFNTAIAGAGIFLPAHRANKIESPTLAASTLPPTPTTPSQQNGDFHRSVAQHQTPPTPSVHKLSQSLGPGAKPAFSRTIGPGGRAPSPQNKLKPRGSLPRPGSPTRNSAGSQPAVTPGRAFSASVRGGRPGFASSHGPGAKLPPTKPFASAGNRSPSRTGSQLSNRSPVAENPPPVSRFSQSTRAPSRGAPSRGPSRGPAEADAAALTAASEESESLKRNLEERDRQLRDQASSLAEMETSLAELQSIMAEQRHQPRGNSIGSADEGASDVSYLRALIREKNEKIAMLTSEFDGHRADFRSTIDTLEMASTETERVYEQRVQELLQEVRDLQDGGNDVESFARQLKQLEELVAELEEGLEDARRGEAEARGEVEFLRGEVERGRSELRRERDKAAKALRGAGAAVNGPKTPGGPIRDIEARDDEIRGLKAIIHSLSSNPDVGTPTVERNGFGSDGASAAMKEEMAGLRESLHALEREKAELQGMVKRKSHREEELERELGRLRRDSGKGDLNNHRSMARATHNHHDSIASTQTTIRPSSLGRDAGPSPNNIAPSPPQFDRATLNSLTGGAKSAPLASSRPGTSGDNSAFHDASETASVGGAEAVCDFCEQKGHDVLGCPNVSGGGDAASKRDTKLMDSSARVAPLAMAASKSPTPPATTPATPMPSGDGPAAGKASGVIDMSKWCAMCERDGHESVDCPFEDF